MKKLIVGLCLIVSSVNASNSVEIGYVVSNNPKDEQVLIEQLADNTITNNPDIDSLSIKREKNYLVYFEDKPVEDFQGFDKNNSTLYLVIEFQAEHEFRDANSTQRIEGRESIVGERAVYLKTPNCEFEDVEKAWIKNKKLNNSYKTFFSSNRILILIKIPNEGKDRFSLELGIEGEKPNDIHLDNDPVTIIGDDDKEKIASRWAEYKQY